MFGAAGQEVNGMAYAMEFRRAAAKAYDKCGSSTEVAAALGCSASWVRRLIQRRAVTDSLAPLPQRRADTRKLCEPELERPTRAGAAHARPDAGGTGRGIGHRRERVDGLACDAAAGPDAQKKPTHAAEQDRPDVKAQRDVWFDQFAAVEVRDLVFLDEFRAATNMARLRPPRRAGRV